MRHADADAVHAQFDRIVELRSDLHQVRRIVSSADSVRRRRAGSLRRRRPAPGGRRRSPATPRTDRGRSAAKKANQPAWDSTELTSTPRISRCPSAFTPVATRQATLTTRPASRTSWSTHPRRGTCRASIQRWDSECLHLGVEVFGHHADLAAEDEGRLNSSDQDRDIIPPSFGGVG